MKTLIGYLSLMLFIVSCGATKTSNSYQEADEKYKELATEKLGDGVSYVLNDSKRHVLCISEAKGTVKQPRNMLSYMVIKISDNTSVLENKVDGGTVRWSNDSEIEVYIIPGIMRHDQTSDDYTTIYNVESGKSRKKTAGEQH